VVAARCSVLVGLLIGCSEPTSIDSTLFITDYRANAIVRYDGATGELIDVFASGAAARVDRPASVQRGPDGFMYAAGFGRGDIVRYDADSGDMMDVFYWDTTLLEEPMELAFHRDQLLVLGNDTKNLVVIAEDGRAMREFGFPTMRAAQDFVIDGERVFVATDTNPTAIQVWDLATGTLVRAFGTYDDVWYATGLELHAGVLYVCDWERQRVMRFDPETGASLGVLADTHLSAPVELAIGPDGGLHVLDANGVQTFDLDTGAFRGTLVEVDGTILQRPSGFTFVD
jgi:sugar lactone lactonase YvrE